MSRRDLLAEIGSEELPPLALIELADAFLAGVLKGLGEAKLKHGKAQRFATPRRLAVHVKGVAEQQPEIEVNRRGPPVKAAFDATGAPTRAAVAFAESCGASVDALQRVQEPKGEFLFYSGRRPGAMARDLIAGIVQASLDALPIPKRMRWGSNEVEFVRPVHWVVLLFGKEVLPGKILGLTPGNITYGHRFHSPRPIRIASPASYVSALRKRGFVLADIAERRERIRTGVIAAAQAAGGEALAEDALLDEVTSLVEWPVPLTGAFDARFLELPREVLIATLQDHQRYFPIQAIGATGEEAVSSEVGRPQVRPLLARFVAVANIESRDPAQVRAGNERVVKPRLADAAFFFDSDRRQRLDARIAGLARVTFQTRLGSLGDKSARVSELAGEIARRIAANVDRARRAAMLCKADLLTAMVGEFPELQGTMGRYYAVHDGEDAHVAAAIEEHYWPRFAGDALPRAGVSQAVALADRIDTIAAIFSIDEKPTGTRDPFGLRRAALGVLRISIEGRLDLDLPSLIERVLVLLREQAASRTPAGGAESGAKVVVKVDDRSPGETIDAVYAYIMERLRAYYLDSDAAQPSGVKVTTEMFDAVLATRPASPLDFDARLRALSTFLALDAAASLAAANKRIANILRKSEAVPATSVRSELLGIDAEKNLYASLQSLRPEVEPLLEQRRYSDALERLANLREPVDRFFDTVMVMDPDANLRGNRLALLGELRQLFLRTADLSRLPG